MDPITGNALLAAGSRLLPSLLGGKGPSLRKQANTQRKSQIKYERDSFRQSMQQQEKRFKTLVKAAQRAGFNPSTALAAGGLAAGGSAQMQMGTPQSPMQLGSALGGAIGAFADKMDPVSLETARLNQEIAKQQLANLQNESLNPYGTMRKVRQDATKDTKGNPIVGQTGYGDEIAQDKVAEEAIDARIKDSGYFKAYSMLDAPEWWPSAGYLEETFGDDSFVTNTHKKLTPWVVGAYNFGEAKDGIAKWREQTRIRKGETAARKEHAKTRRTQHRGTPQLESFMSQNFPTVFD
ncbi:hypothetical protein [Microviridae sp.]|nr:hypothetical protein [Microviridae sp.]